MQPTVHNIQKPDRRTASLDSNQHPVIAGNTPLSRFIQGPTDPHRAPRGLVISLLHRTRRPARLTPRMPSTAVTVCCILLHGTSEEVWVAWYHHNVRALSCLAFRKWELPPPSATLQAFKQPSIGACQTRRPRIVQGLKHLGVNLTPGDSPRQSPFSELSSSYPKLFLVFVVNMSSGILSVPP